MLQQRSVYISSSLYDRWFCEFIPPTVGELLGWFYFLSIMSSGAVNILLYAFGAQWLAFPL